MLRHVRVHSRERVVQQHEVCVGDHRAREADARLLPAAEVDPALADLRRVAVHEEAQVVVQRAGRQGRVVAGLTQMHRKPENRGKTKLSCTLVSSELHSMAHI